MMNKPTEAMIKAGNDVASELMDANMQKCLGGIGGCKKFKLSNFKYKKIVKAHLAGEIDSVTGIWMAMEEVREI